jgi:phosphoribosylformimino-5-aminoimidazole carboxamide ribotide isomerase
MEIWPAIDIRGGQCVRLQQGDYQRETVFGADPVAMAKRWVDAGADRLHLVDLDGARDGQVINRVAIQQLLETVHVPCELGGGIRDEATIAAWLEIGIERLVVGTRAIEDASWFREMLRRYPHRLVLGIDARDGRVATDGWLKTSEVSATELAKAFRDEPLAAIVYTDISKDGMMAGPNLEAMAEMKAAADCPVIASGGVTVVEDVAQLARLGIDGCIIGRALYEGRMTLADALAAAS